jgi:hypothetical protein
MNIECIIRRKGGSIITLSEKTYHFVPQEDGRHIAEVTDENHVERFLRVPEAYRIARAPGSSPTETQTPRVRKAPKQEHPALEEKQTLKGSVTQHDAFEIQGVSYAHKDYEAQERSALFAQYQQRFGKLPPVNMKTETIKAKLAKPNE